MNMCESLGRETAPHFCSGAEGPGVLDGITVEEMYKAECEAPGTI